MAGAGRARNVHARQFNPIPSIRINQIIVNEIKEIDAPIEIKKINPARPNKFDTSLFFIKILRLNLDW